METGTRPIAMGADAKSINTSQWQLKRTMLSELNKAVVCRYFEAYGTGDIEAVMEFIDPHYVLHPGGGGEPMNSFMRKRDEQVFFKAFSNIEAIVEDQIAEGDKVASRITMYCTHTGEYQSVPATGKRITIPYIDITLIKAGKIVEEWVEYDTMNILRQIRVRNVDEASKR
jgi:predicted ester cyclase